MGMGEKVMGRLIVLEGLDGSGKATQTALLLEKLQAQGKPVRKVSFPNYESPASALIKMYLGGEFGAHPEDVNAYAASSFYAVDRYASWKTDWGGFYNNGGTIIADRYATSNAIHQCAKLPQQEWPGYTAWMEDFEYGKLGIPKPNLVIYLDVEPEVSQQLMSRRYGNDEAKKDIHERDFAYLQACRKAAIWCVQNLGWQHLLCSRQGNMRSIEEISADILKIIEEHA